MRDYLIVFAAVFGVNLLPAFGPPTWSILVFLRLNLALPAVPLVLVGAVAAALGRLTLASGTRRLRPRLSQERRDNLAAAQELLAGSRRRAAAGIGLFAISPVPSAQLFVAAGLMTVPLIPLTAAFFIGRLVSYAFYVTAATLAEKSLGGILEDSLTSPSGIALQVLMLGLLVLLLRVDWVRLLAKAGSPKLNGDVADLPSGSQEQPPTRSDP